MRFALKKWADRLRRLYPPTVTRRPRRRAAISVVSNIAEGAEKTDWNFCRFMSIALGSCAEVERQVIIAGDLGLVSPMVAQVLEITGHIGKMIRRLMMLVRGLGEVAGSRLASVRSGQMSGYQFRRSSGAYILFIHFPGVTPFGLPRAGSVSLLRSSRNHKLRN